MEVTSAQREDVEVEKAEEDPVEVVDNPGEDELLEFLDGQ